MNASNDRSRCCYCGQFVAFDDIAVYGNAVTRMVTPDSHFTREEYETYHTDCKAAADAAEAAQGWEPGMDA